jgi:CRISPR/Cas system-associated endonuclease Cas1
MTLTTDNKELNAAIINLSNAMQATDAAINNIDFNFDKLDELEAIEAEAENNFFKIIFSMMPKKVAEQMQQPKYIALFKAKTIDKYILG